MADPEIRSGMKKGRPHMKFFDFPSAPSPRRVRIFFAEKGISVPTEKIDLTKGEQFSPAYRAINPSCTVPALQLDDGSIISEILAICRYFEEVQPEPALMGRTPKEKAIITMWERRMEIDGYLAVMEGFRNSVAGLKGRALVGPHDYEQILALAERGKQRTLNFYDDLDARLRESPFVAGEAFSIADITAVVTIDFASRGLKLPVPETLAGLLRWKTDIAARPSLSA
jgi:glutathione S-transferase